MCLIVVGMPATPRIGTTIRRARERKRMSQKKLAEELGVSRSAVNAWENDRAWPQNSIGALEEVLGISLGEEPEPGELRPENDWETRTLNDPDLPDDWKRFLVTETRPVRAAYRAQRAGARSRGEAAG